MAPPATRSPIAARYSRRRAVSGAAGPFASRPE
ncbi:Uncharacterised protein [Mycobacteroides abscessus]|nr:Uncharacterised protein [Mycobacteroides abscessus]